MPDTSAKILPTPERELCSKCVASVANSIIERMEKMKFVKCDLCGDMREADETSTITYEPCENDECCPCFVTKSGESDPASLKKMFDVCDKCAARILQALTKKRVVPSILTQYRESKDEGAKNSETESKDGDTE